jgi:hypothetical protein
MEAGDCAFYVGLLPRGLQGRDDIDASAGLPQSIAGKSASAMGRKNVTV